MYGRGEVEGRDVGYGRGRGLGCRLKERLG